MMLKLAGFLLCASFLCGCHSGGGAPEQKTNYFYEDSDAAKAAQQGKEFEDPSKVSQSAVTKAQVKAKETQQAKLAAQLSERPKEADLKKQFIQFTNELALDEMSCDDLTPHEKYSSALKYYRQVLKVDPKDPDASQGADTIISVYKSMGRPVPN